MTTSPAATDDTGRPASEASRTYRALGGATAKPAPQLSPHDSPADTLGLFGLVAQALPPDLGPELLRQGHDEAGNPVQARTDPTGGLPLRCCLRDSRPGDTVVLAAVTPPGPAGAYQERGPVFLHADNCGGADPDARPEVWRTRRQVLRAYGPDGILRDGVVVTPEQDQAVVAAQLLADPDTAFLHSRNVEFGCYLLAIHRSPSGHWAPNRQVEAPPTTSG